MNRTVNNKFMAAGVLLFLVFWGGCGTGDYEQRLDARIKELKLGSKFNLLSSAINVPGTQVSIRVPQKNDSNKNAFENLFSPGFENPPLQEAVGVDGKPIDPKRLKPLIVDVADLKLTFEGFVKDRDNGQQAYYLYIAVSTRAGRVNIPKLMQADLASKLKDVTALTDIKAQTPEGRDVLWQECHGTGKQQFYYIKPPPPGATQGEGQFVQLDGTIQMMFHDENDSMVTVIWRWPAGIDKSIDPWIDMVAGCVKVGSKSPAAE
jgi:hypothetical protein